MKAKTSLFLFCSLLLVQAACPQGKPAVATRLAAAVGKLEADTSMRHAGVSFYVVDAASGAVVFDRNSELGLAPASCQKLFTSVAALDMLGPDYRYHTRIGYSGKIERGVLKGYIHLFASGDPSLGSWRYDSTKEEVVLARLAGFVRKAGIKKYKGSLNVYEGPWGTDAVPRGWIWEDIGNYYGAGAWGLNWHENQYDVRLQPGKAVGDPVKIKDIGLESGVQLSNELTTGAAGSGDNAYIFLPPYGTHIFLRGTVPLQKAEMVISGSIPIPSIYALLLLQKEFARQGMAPTSLATSSDIALATSVGEIEGLLTAKDSLPQPDVIIGESVSPRLDSINYWFLKKSINLYGEALLKTIAVEKTGMASTEKGAELVKDFWAERGIDRSALHIIDGSGLSPQNRVTTHGLVQVLQYARTRPWYATFYQSLPLINGMHMKSGAIGGARSYAGYQVAADGKEYVFSIIVNNYDGSASEVVRKLFDLLNIMKGG